ncbi:conserved Plasmodium protein, unknown function [Plasmodium sp. DRC-Itaito]|nr:conserved Plasmodium protein, unknown function [Plasmodium sp. DRC-Itaito]
MNYNEINDNTMMNTNDIIHPSHLNNEKNGLSNEENYMNIYDNNNDIIIDNEVDDHLKEEYNNIGERSPEGANNIISDNNEIHSINNNNNNNNNNNDNNNNDNNKNNNYNNNIVNNTFGISINGNENVNNIDINNIHEEIHNNNDKSFENLDDYKVNNIIHNVNNLINNDELLMNNINNDNHINENLSSLNLNITQDNNVNTLINPNIGINNNKKIKNKNKNKLLKHMNNNMINERTNISFENNKKNNINEVFLAQNNNYYDNNMVNDMGCNYPTFNNNNNMYNHMNNENMTYMSNNQFMHPQVYHPRMLAENKNKGKNKITTNTYINNYIMNNDNLNNTSSNILYKNIKMNNIEQKKKKKIINIKTDGTQISSVESTSEDMNYSNEYTAQKKHVEFKETNDPLILHPSTSYIRNIVIKKPSNIRNSIHNLNLYNVNSMTFDSYYTNKNATNIIYKNESNTNDRNNNIILNTNETNNEHNNMENLINNPSFRIYKPPIFISKYIKDMNEEELNDIYTLLNDRIIKSEENDKAINYVKNEIINLYKQNPIQLLTLQKCLSLIKANRNIIEVMFYILENNKLINMQCDPQYYNSYINNTSYLNYQTVNNKYKHCKNESSYGNHNNCNEFIINNMNNGRTSDSYGNLINGDDTSMMVGHDGETISSKLCNKKYNQISNISNHNKNKNNNNNKNNKNNYNNNNNNNINSCSGNIYNLHNDINVLCDPISKKLEWNNNERISTKESKTHNSKSSNYCNNYNYKCISCDKICENTYYILKPTNIKRISYGVIDKCIWCSVCYNSSNYPNILNSSNFVKVNIPYNLSNNDWNINEIEKLIEGVCKFKNNWEQISEYIQTKTPYECIYKFISMPLSNPYFDLNNLYDINNISLNSYEQNNTLLSLLSFICNNISPYVGAYAAKKIVDYILQKQKEENEKEKKEQMKQKDNHNEDDTNKIGDHNEKILNHIYQKEEEKNNLNEQNGENIKEINVNHNNNNNNNNNKNLNDDNVNHNNNNNNNNLNDDNINDDNLNNNNLNDDNLNDNDHLTLPNENNNILNNNEIKNEGNMENNVEVNNINNNCQINDNNSVSNNINDSMKKKPSTYILKDDDMKIIHDTIIKSSKKRSRELADLEEHNLKKLLKELVLLNTRKVQLKLKQHEYLQKYFEYQNEFMVNKGKNEKQKK